MGKTGSDDVEWLFQQSVVLFLQNCTTVRLLESMFTKKKILCCHYDANNLGFKVPHNSKTS